MAETTTLEFARDGVVDLTSESRRDFWGNREKRASHGVSQPMAKVPLLDWPADLFAKGAAIVENLAEDCSVAWYGSHMQDIPA
jgi:hypothetical protein